MSVLECMCILWIQVCLSKSRKAEIISVPCEMISSIAVVNIERGYANKTMQNDMQRIIDILGRRSNRSSYFF